MKTSSEPIEYAFDGDVPRTAGVCSTISFQNKAFMEGLRLMFDTDDDEMIVSVSIEDGKISAYFEIKNETV